MPNFRKKTVRGNDHEKWKREGEICHAIAHLFYNGIRILAPKGSNGTFRLFLEGGDAEMFEVSPVEVINEASFSIRVRDPDQLDYERIRDVDTDFLANGLD